MAADARWIDLLDPTEQELGAALPCEIHDRALELLLEPARHDDEPRPRLEGHDHYVFGVLLVPVCIREEDRVFYQEVDVVATREQLVTVRKTPERGYPFDASAVHEAVQAAGETRTGAMVYELVDTIAEDYLSLVDALNDEIDELEEGIDRWSGAQVRNRISALRHDLLHVRRTLAPMRDAVRRVVDRGSTSARGRRSSRAISSFPSPTFTTSFCARSTVSISLGTCWRAHATTTRRRSRTTRTR